MDEKQRNEIILINEQEQSIDFKRKIISDEELIPLKGKLNQIMQQQKPYLDSELNLIKLAEILKITAPQLSYVINFGFNENFFQYINKYRVHIKYYFYTTLDVLNPGDILNGFLKRY